MIVVKWKPLDEILDMVKEFNSVLIVGCDTCAAVVQAGGRRQVETMKTMLEMANKLKFGNRLKIGSISIPHQCNPEIVRTHLGPVARDYEAFLSLACGVGVQTIASVFTDKAVIPGNNTMFIGEHNWEERKFYEMCRACGNCILFETGGICPITRCAKGLLNGPCGGQANGKCEVGGWTRDCAWIQIYERLKARGRLDLFTKFRGPRDYSISQNPRELELK